MDVLSLLSIAFFAVVLFALARRKLARADAALAESRVEVARLSERLATSAARLSDRERAFADLELHVRELAAAKAALAAQLDAERANMTEKVEFLSQAKQQLGDQFKALAGDILEEKRKAFSEHSQSALGQLMTPFATSIEAFKKRIDEIYSSESQQRAALSREIKLTLELNQTLAKGAEELARALKGSAKTQGNWGELVLETVLEASGLRRGREYDAQLSSRHDDGSRGQPDVVIRLPEARHLVIDSKVSLDGYRDYMNAENDTARDAALKRHLDSVRGHIKDLSSKRYQDLYDIRTLDFVLLFIPIEPAFMLAVGQDDTLFMHAWEKNVILVSPSTLLFVLRTVASLWRQEQQTQNAQEIAHRGAELYDKLCGFVADLDKLGKSLQAAQLSFDEARAKLSTGKGNVIRQAQQLRSLGLKPSKQLPPALVERAEEHAEERAG